jgi:hypothetical protein
LILVQIFVGAHIVSFGFALGETPAISIG